MLLADNKVGIGTTTFTPTHKLSVLGDTSIQTSLSVGSNTLNGGIQVGLPTTYTNGYMGAGARVANGWGNQSSATAGYIYAWDGDWNNSAQADSSSTTYHKLLGVSNGNDMVLDGVVKVGINPGGSNGDPVYLDAAAGGRGTTTAPTGSNQYVRIIGYVVDSTNGLIYFCPDKTWIKLTA